MTLLNFNFCLRRCIQRDYIPSNSSVQTRLRPGISIPTLFVSMMACLAFTSDITIELVFSKISLSRRWVEETADDWTTYGYTAFSIQASKLFFWTVTNSIFSARSSIDVAVCLISSPTCFWWSPSSSWRADMTSILTLAAGLERRTLEAHVSTRWELEASERLHEYLL